MTGGAEKSQEKAGPGTIARYIVGTLAATISAFLLAGIVDLGTDPTLANFTELQLFWFVFGLAGWGLVFAFGSVCLLLPSGHPRTRFILGVVTAVCLVIMLVSEFFEPNWP